MFGFRQALRFPLRNVNKLCIHTSSPYQQQCHHQLRKLSINSDITQGFSTKTNAINDDNLKDDKLTKYPVGKLEGRLMIQFTCKKCNTRNSKTMSKLAYAKGVVIIRCDGCKNNHLIADNLGWFGADRMKRNIEKRLSLEGENIKRLSSYDGELFEFLRKE